MARYRLLQPHYLGDRHFLAGTIVDWNGPPSRAMEPIDDAAREAIAKLEAQGGPARRLPRRQTRNRSYLQSALHQTLSSYDPSNMPGARVVSADEQDRPASPPKLPA
jgi:hypothetical protein